MLSLPFSVTLLALLTILIFLGLGERILDNMRLTDSAAVLILILMILGHFLPTISISRRLAVNLGGFIPVGVALYLLITTSRLEQKRAALVSFLTGLLILLCDKLLPLLPGVLDPVLSGGIFAGLLATILGRPGAVPLLQACSVSSLLTSPTSAASVSRHQSADRPWKWRSVLQYGNKRFPSCGDRGSDR